MCVIIVKPAGVKMPTNEVLRAAFEANPHGCGFATPSTFFKTLSYRALKQRLNKVDESEPCIIHFRLATHGSVKRQNCHPFKRGNVYFAHNGILDITPKGDMTDSETAFESVIYPVIERYGIDSPLLDLTIKGILGYSKFALLQGQKLRLFGDFIEQSDGCFYSNLRFKALMGWRYNNCLNHRYTGTAFGYF